jgi:hypothetical protein
VIIPPEEGRLHDGFEELELRNPPKFRNLLTKQGFD